ncbi:hypothetical protein I4F81_001607 [Pyropia yezoensis]|uniref:Uncharacterized protein n=1 Tax=Pyropia yezoensis TaxID=2788 RepID=A0ACC3BN41_PYRYE|nr:hypothetical protein I4F81_001607 [Neopyropia yezoensis]
MTASNSDRTKYVSMDFCLALNRTVEIAPRFKRMVPERAADPVQRLGEKVLIVGVFPGSRACCSRRCSLGR